MKFCFSSDKNSYTDLCNIAKNRCLTMSSLLMLFTFQSGDSSGEESEESRRSSSSRSDENVEKFD